MTTIEVTSLEQYLQIHVDLREKHNLKSTLAYSCFEDFVLQHGTLFTEISPDQPKWGQRNRYRPRPMKACFHNAYCAAVASRGRLRYAEGYAEGGFMPVHHAWNLTEDRRSLVAVMRAPTERIFGEVAIRAEDGNVIALRLPGKSPVEVAVILPSDAEFGPMGDTVAIYMVDGQELEGLFTAARALPAVHLDDQLSVLAPLSTVSLAHVRTSGSTIPLPVLRRVLPEVFAASSASLEPFAGSALAATGTYLVHPSESIHAAGTKPSKWRVAPRWRVVDTTWWHEDRKLGPPVGTAYYGLIFPIEYVKAVRTKDNCSIIDQWQKGWPLLQNKFDGNFEGRS